MCLKKVFDFLSTFFFCLKQLPKPIKLGFLEVGTIVAYIKVDSKGVEDMTKFAIATHGNLSKGIQSTLEFFIPNEEIVYLAAYVEDELPIEEQLAAFIRSLADEELAVIFTDIFGGSVNQKAILEVGMNENVFIVAGFNVPVILEILLNKNDLSKEKVKQLVESSKEAMVLVDLDLSEENEEDFF